jgi:competence protein ComEC
MIKQPSTRLWGFVFLGCVASTYVKQLPSTFSLLMMLALSGITCILFFRFRYIGTAPVFQLIHFVLGLSLPLCWQTESSVDLATYQKGLTVTISSITRDHEGIRMFGVAQDELLVSANLRTGARLPVPGQRGWLAGPCKRVTLPENFKALSTPTRIRCRGPFYQALDQGLPRPWIPLRTQFLKAMDSLDSREGRSVLKAITLGDKREISGQLFDKFTHVGANHLLAVSGLHIAGMSGLLYGLLVIIFGYFNWSNPKPLALCASCCMACALLLVADGPVGASRAFLTYFTVGTMTLLGRRCDAIEIVCLAATMMMLEQPNIWRSIGFQLSFVSVLSIVTMTQRGAWWRQSLEVSLWSTVATAPLCAYYFGTVAPSGVITNLLLVPLTTMVLMPAAWVGLLLLPITKLPLEFSGEVAVYFICVLEQLHELGSQMWVIGTNGAFAVGLISLSLVLLRFSKVKTALALMLATLCLPEHSGDEVHFLAVGQGDATLIKSEGKVALLDAGPKYSGQRLLRVCRRLGVNQIDVLVISHQHPDHFEGLEALIGRIPIGQLIVPTQARTSSSLIRIERALRSEGTRITKLDDKPTEIGRFSLHPLAPEINLTGSENDASIAMFIEHQHGALMIMGDLEKRGEMFLIEQTPPQVDILRIGHHGSRTSTHTALLNTLCPTHLVMSLGFGNRFGFPHQETMRRIRRHGAGLWRTDLDGRIIVRFNEKLEMEAVNQALRPTQPAAKSRRCHHTAKTAFN